MKKKTLSLLLVVAMLLAMIPAVFATTGDNIPSGNTVLIGGGATGTEFTISRNAAGTGVAVSPDSGVVGTVDIVAYADGKKPAPLTTGYGDLVSAVGSYDASNSDTFIDDENYNGKVTPNVDFVMNGAENNHAAVTFPATASGTWHIWAVHETAPGDVVEHEVELVNGKIKEPLSVNTDALNQSATVGTAFTIDLSGKVSGGSGNYTYEWDTSSAARPAGVELKNGKITGTPTAVTTGAVALKVKVSDNSGTSYDANLITVNLTVGQGAATVALAPASGTYTGSAHTPAVTVTLPGKTTEASDYEVAWAPTGLTNAGTYTGTVTLKNANYAFAAGTNTVTYTINKADPDGEVEFTFDEEKEDLTLADITVDITGVLGVDGKTLPGEFAFLDENSDPIDEADLADYPVTPDTAYDYRFTPTDATNYNVAENDVTFLGQPQEPDTHAAFMFGTTADGKTFEPDRGMTRAEVAVMIANLDGYDKDVDYAAKLTKIPQDLKDEKANLEKWTDNGYNKLCYILNEGIMQGRDDGDFHPYDIITRQEMAIVLGKYLGIAQNTGANQFSDLDDSAVYAEGKGYINALKVAGKIDGFPDGEYKPTQNLTRAQAAKMMNYAMNREPDIAKMKAANVSTDFTDVQKFIGNADAEWALYNIIEASKPHPVSDFH